MQGHGITVAVSFEIPPERSTAFLWFNSDSGSRERRPSASFHVVQLLNVTKKKPLVAKSSETSTNRQRLGREVSTYIKHKGSDAVAHQNLSEWHHLKLQKQKKLIQMDLF